MQHRPEQGLLAIRKALGLFANLRPVATMPELAAASPLKPEKLKGVDILVIRELTGGIYFGKRARSADAAFDTCEYTVAEIERVCRVAGKLAMARRRKVTSVDKANVLDTSRLWRDVATRVFRTEFPELDGRAPARRRGRDASLEPPGRLRRDGHREHVRRHPDRRSVDARGLDGPAALRVARRRRSGLYEPIHGSAPDIAGQGVANPCGTILSAAMLLRHSCGAEAAAQAIEDGRSGRDARRCANARHRGARRARLARHGGIHRRRPQALAASLTPSLDRPQRIELTY